MHILGHIPPGHVDCVRVWSANFNAIVGRYSHIIAGQFYGHTHLDEFQLFFSKEKNQKESTVMQVEHINTSKHISHIIYRFLNRHDKHINVDISSIRPTMLLTLHPQ